MRFQSREDVRERLTHDPEIDATEIEVQVTSGEITLTGTVDSREAKRKAEDAVENVSGAKQVHNQLRVQQGALVGHGQQSGSPGQQGQQSGSQSQQSGSQSQHSGSKK